MSEIYIYLGKQSQVFFFLHTISETKQFKHEISHQILNVLIHEGFVDNYENICIIYEINPLDFTTKAIVINHANSQFYEFYKDNLENQLKRLMSLERTDEYIFSISYDYKIRGYLTYDKVPYKIPKREMTISLEGIEYIQTTKEITFC